MNVPLADIAGDFQVRETIVLMTGTALQIAAQDPSRWCMMVTPAALLANIGISTRGAVTVNDGFIFTAQGQIFEIYFSREGGLTQSAWYGIGGAGSSLTVLEVFYRPQGG